MGCTKATFFKDVAFVLKYVSIELFSRAVASRVSSPQQSLTSVFGMGTGGPSALKSLTFVIKKITENRINRKTYRQCVVANLN